MNAGGASATPAMGSSKPTMVRGPYLLRIECKFVFLGPLHVGTGEALGLETDSPALRLPFSAPGRNLSSPWLPSTSIRGVLADWCQREAVVLGIDPSAVYRLLGRSAETSLEGKTAEQVRDLHRAGRLIVADAELTQASAEVRDHVRIDPRYAAASDGGKFDQENLHIASGTLRLQYEGDGPDDAEIELLRAALGALRDRLLGFGAKGGWGLGIVEGQVPIFTAVQRNEPAGLSAYFRHRLDGKTGLQRIEPPDRAPAQRDQDNRTECVRLPLQPPLRHPWSWLRLNLRLHFDGPMLVAEEYRGMDFQSDEARADHTYRVDPADRPYLPGAGLRGTLRGVARRLVSNLAHGESILTKLFGPEPEAGRSGRPAERENDDGALFRGLLRVGEGRLAGDAETVALNHVAIDRITNFAVNRKLFSTAALASPVFETEISVRWRPTFAEEKQCQQELAAPILLLFLLRAGAEGLLWSGSRTTRGYGYIKAISIDDAALSLVEGGNGSYRRVEPIARHEAEPDARKWLVRLQEHLQPELNAWNALIDDEGCVG